MREWTTLPPWHPELPTTACKPLAPSASGPLYRQAKRELQRVVESGRCRPGETLPSESVIAAALGVSIGTLRKAVDELVHEHVLVRRQGKGTFVALHNDDRFLFQFFHVEPRDEFPVADDLREREYPHGGMRGLHCATGPMRPKRRLCASSRGTRCCASPIACRWRAGPWCYDRLVVAAQTFRGLNEKRFLERPSTIYNLYQTDHGITVLRAREWVRARSADSETARILGVAVGLPVLEVHRIALTFGDKPVEYRISTINTASHDYVSLLAKR